MGRWCVKGAFQVCRVSATVTWEFLIDTGNFLAMPLANSPRGISLQGWDHPRGVAQPSCSLTFEKHWFRGLAGN